MMAEPFPLRDESEKDADYRVLKAVWTKPSVYHWGNREAHIRTCPTETQLIKTKGIKFIAPTGEEVFALRFPNGEVFGVYGAFFNWYESEKSFLAAIQGSDLRTKGRDLL